MLLVDRYFYRSLVVAPGYKGDLYLNITEMILYNFG